MIFGFNTDVKYGTTVYHVQSEAREHELLLQTQVFMKGRCIGKHAVSYADKMSQPGFSDEQMHQLLKDQHKRIVEAARAGRVEQEITHASPAPAAPVQPGPAPAAPVAAQPTPAPPPSAPVEPRKTTAPQPAQALVEAVALTTAEPSAPAVRVEPPPPEVPAEVPTSQPTSILPVRLTRSTLSPSIAGDYSAPEQAAPVPFEFAPEEPEPPRLRVSPPRPLLPPVKG